MIGKVFLGKYQVTKLLGEGAMGKVYLANDRNAGRQVVVKVMHDHVAAQPKFRDLFEREMQFMARFQHAHVVALIESSVKEGLCIIMEYVPGTDVEHLLQRQRRFEPARVGRLLGQLCSALQSAHNESIIHRDLKPANLMVMNPDTPEEHLKVMDFGLAKLSGTLYIPMERLKSDGNIIATGTPEYIAPEQVRGDEMDHRGDIYSVGVILFEMLTGRLPFLRNSIQETLRAHADDPAPSFASVGAGGLVPSVVEALVQRCLYKYPNERPQTAWEVAQRYEQALGVKFLSKIEPPKAASAKPPTASTRPIVGRNAVVHEIEAWMPEAIAAIKLRGFVQDAKGEVIESVPGMIRVRLGGPGCSYQLTGATSLRPAAAAPPKGPLGWFSRGSSSQQQPPGMPFEVELHMEKRNPQQSSQLTITLVLRPPGTMLPGNPQWTDCCNRVYKELRSYLMGN